MTKPSVLLISTLLLTACRSRTPLAELKEDACACESFACAAKLNKERIEPMMARYHEELEGKEPDRARQDKDVALVTALGQCIERFFPVKWDANWR